MVISWPRCVGTTGVRKLSDTGNCALMRAHANHEGEGDREAWATDTEGLTVTDMVVQLKAHPLAAKL